MYEDEPMTDSLPSPNLFHFMWTREVILNQYIHLISFWLYLFHCRIYWTKFKLSPHKLLLWILFRQFTWKELQEVLEMSCRLVIYELCIYHTRELTHKHKKPYWSLPCWRSEKTQRIHLKPLYMCCRLVVRIPVAGTW